MKPLRQVELEVRLGQLKSQANDNSNPYYDNSYKNNRDIYRENNNTSSNDIKNYTPIQSQRPPIDRNGDVPAQNQRRNYAAEPAEGKGFFDNFGDNQRHNNIQNDLRAYVRKLNSRDYQPSEIGGFYKNQEGRDKSNGRGGRKAQNQSVNNQKEDWYVQNYNVGILPGMGKPEDGRSSINRQKTFEVSPMQERYNNDQTRGSERPAMTRDDVGSARLAGGGSQLANAGSRIVDGDDFRGFGSRLDQIKVPESFGDYGNLEQRKDIYNNVLQYSKSPQFRDFPSYQKPATNFDGIINERAGSVNDLVDWRVNNGVRKQPSMMQNEATEFGNKRSLGFSSEIPAAPSKVTPSDEKIGAGTNWLKQRENEEVDKKQRQREELQRVYQEQMEEKKRKKEEEKRKQWLEDQKEEERLRKENEEIQRQFALEVQKKKEQELAKENAQLKLNEVVEDFTNAANKRKQSKFNKAFETSEENSLRREPFVMKQEEVEPEREVRYDPPPRRLEDLVKETAKFVEDETRFKKRVEFSKDPELEVHKAVMRRIDATLDEQLNKMKKDLSLHTQLLRDSQATYKQQALVASELRQNAQKDLLRLREDLRMQQVEEETRPFQNLNFTPAQELKQASSTKQLFPQSKAPEKPGLRLGTNTKNYSKMQPIQSYDQSDDFDLGGGGASRMGMTLDVDTHYVPVKGLGDLSLETSRAENKYALESKNELVGFEGEYEDVAKNRFDSLFPGHSKQQSHQNSDAHIEHNYRAAIKEVKNGGGIELNEHRFNYMKGPTQVRQYEKAQNNRKKKDDFGDVEGADEIERLDNLLKRYKEHARHQDDDDGEMELAQETNIKPPHQHSHKRIPTPVQEKFDDLGDYELPDREEDDDALNVANNHIGDSNGDVHHMVVEA